MVDDRVGSGECVGGGYGGECGYSSVECGGDSSKVVVMVVVVLLVV